MSVGDVNSDARGSGARYNDGKVQLGYIPAAILHRCEFGAWSKSPDAATVLNYLSQFEEGRDPAWLVLALRVIDWPDICAVFHYGAQKYAPWNWAKGMPWSVPVECAKRHLVAAMRGERTDPESGETHLGHAGCNLVMLLHYVEHYREGDDLPPLSVFGQ